ncbi:hypothetical protein ABFS82_10G159200 [Erythranthe guttata]|uniref:uncharacterized protein LOC105949445 isoform X2 n=1 Tax=Erythranthe guttata TaxID=4155 RepID=UPI00064DB40D|nr:PREDICTED: uncharacterized protein LOC105949445 isoform X2 [Erythranthe guttata]|eukprot:XP_012828212.1 PREDICTED: uncharacterized protein LOC105949445 isoform X2 [Erythranthe guttata]
MENRRRRNWESNRRSQNRRPPRGNWQPIVPSWEKEFCRVVGSLDWETLLQMKKFVHLYENILKWDDSAVEEAFSNAKKRFWAEINGLPCDISLPDPDQYIDTVDWDSQTNYVPDLESEPVISNPDQEHDPVIIFGDSLLPNQAYSSTGWGDEEENFKLPANSSSANNNGAEWEQNWGDSFDNVVPIGWSGDSINACHFVNEDGWNNNDCGWNNDSNTNNNNTIREVGPATAHKVVSRQVPSGRAWGAQGQDRHRNNNISRNQKATRVERENPREWNSFTSCGPASRNAAITVGQKWNR